MAQRFAVVTVSDEAATLRVEGELDLVSADSLYTAAENVSLHVGDVLSLDLSGVSFIDSSGVRSLFRVVDRAELSGARVILINPSGVVRRVLDIVGGSKRLDIQDTGD